MTRPGLGKFKQPRLPAIEESELGSLPAIAARRPGVPLVEIRLAIRMGRQHVLHPAVPSVLSRAILAGTERRDRAELTAAVELVGGTLHASYDGGRLDFSASVLAENLGSILGILAEVLTTATYPTFEVKGDRDRLADETIMALSRPEVIADEALRSRLLAGHPHATPMARPEALSAVTPATVRRLHGTALIPSAAQLVLVGDVRPAKALEQAAEALTPWLSVAGKPPAELPGFPSPPAGPLQLVDRAGSVQSNIRIGAPAPTRSDEAWPAAALANLIFGGMFGSRLVENLRERRGYTYSPRSAIQHERGGSSFVLEADVSTAVTAASLMEIDYEMSRIALTGVTDAELESAKRYSVGTFSFLTATQSGLASTLAMLGYQRLDPGYLESYPARISRTTRAEVDAAAARYLRPSGVVGVVVGDASEVAESVAAIGAYEMAQAPG